MGESFIPCGKTLTRVQKIDTSGVLPEIRNTKITLMCDVKNPVFGERGAAYVYAPQKGASADDVMLLDRGLRHITEVVARELSVDVSTLAGGGAAGAMAAGMVAFFGAEIKMGIDAVLDAVDYDTLLSGTDAVFTGEGKLDSQSLEGKVIYGVASRAKKCGVPVIALVGGIDDDVSEIYRVGVNSVFSINRMPEDFSTARYKSRENLAFAFDNLLRILKI
jgi:glycerate kinase